MTEEEIATSLGDSSEYLRVANALDGYIGFTNGLKSYGFHGRIVCPGIITVIRIVRYETTREALKAEHTNRLQGIANLMIRNFRPWSEIGKSEKTINE